MRVFFFNLSIRIYVRPLFFFNTFKSIMFFFQQTKDKLQWIIKSSMVCLLKHIGIQYILDHMKIPDVLYVPFK